MTDARKLALKKYSDDIRARNRQTVERNRPRREVAQALTHSPRAEPRQRVARVHPVATVRTTSLEQKQAAFRLEKERKERIKIQLQELEKKHLLKLRLYQRSKAARGQVVAEQVVEEVSTEVVQVQVSENVEAQRIAAETIEAPTSPIVSELSTTSDVAYMPPPSSGSLVAERIAMFEKLIVRNGARVEAAGEANRSHGASLPPLQNISDNERSNTRGAYVSRVTPILSRLLSKSRSFESNKEDDVQSSLQDIINFYESTSVEADNGVSVALGTYDTPILSYFSLETILAWNEQDARTKELDAQEANVNSLKDLLTKEEEELSQKESQVLQDSEKLNFKSQEKMLRQQLELKSAQLMEEEKVLKMLRRGLDINGAFFE